MTDDICGYDDTTTGHPCRHPAGSCPVPTHNGAVPDGGNPQGRGTALNQELIESITTHIAEGKSVNSAARMNGIPTSTFYNWLDRGESESDSIYGELLERYVRARGLGEDYVYSTVWDIAAEEGDLATLMSILKQRYPESWGSVNRGEQAAGVIVELGEAEEYEIDPETLEVIE